ncbi:hypothetical protein [Desulfococcus multivorans]|uniref:hypothetical protein n=1 Tax=Desulfococcus multivorans TaxID=897 RepID=UPI001360B4F8|nr:hypothetical protein [Desulfococcus multivorans]
MASNEVYPSEADEMKNKNVHNMKIPLFVIAPISLFASSVALANAIQASRSARDHGGIE